ncbi:ADP-ribosylglycohydrolase family protein [Lysinibacillus sp. BW-2-10]|uniref:ADP-ribosylglycohydrolase family protein n=1 Tax=Lysinibacillus sp. BW-2-10 TaxID=2590030 RepID=UPI0016429C0E|nr:ADP-ribosylglycohydrolase family protein [Lysinibacillus sp. BW-2-10]
MLDKIQGGIFGLAIGDALGCSTEDMSVDEIIKEYGKVTDFVINVVTLMLEEAMDDTEMTFAVVKGIMANAKDPIQEIGKQFIYWIKTNPLVSSRRLEEVISNYNGDWFQAAERIHYEFDELSAGNGSLVRCLPIVLAYSDIKKIDELTVLQSKMTHFDDLAAEACVIYNRIAKRLLDNENLKTAIQTEIKNTRYESDYLDEPDCPPDGYVVHTMRWGLYWLLNCDTFEEVVVGATNMGGDSNTIAALAGGLKGIDVGFKQLPVKYKNNVPFYEKLLNYSDILYEIRDQDTKILRENVKNYLTQLQIETKKLDKFLSQNAIPSDVAELLESIRKNNSLIGIAINEEESNFERKYDIWLQTKLRYRRVMHLFDLNAFPGKIRNELESFDFMVNLLNLIFDGFEKKVPRETVKRINSSLIKY